MTPSYVLHYAIHVFNFHFVAFSLKSGLFFNFSLLLPPPLLLLSFCYVHSFYTHQKGSIKVSNIVEWFWLLFFVSCHIFRVSRIGTIKNQKGGDISTTPSLSKFSNFFVSFPKKKCLDRFSSTDKRKLWRRKVGFSSFSLWSDAQPKNVKHQCWINVLVHSNYSNCLAPKLYWKLLHGNMCCAEKQLKWVVIWFDNSSSLFPLRNLSALLFARRLLIFLLCITHKFV